MEERASVSGCRFRRRSNVAERALSAAVTVSSRLVTCTVVDGVMCNDDEYRWYLDMLAAQLRAVDRRTARSAA